MNDPAANSGVSPFLLSRHSVLDTESRVPGENRDPVFEMVPDFRRDDIWIPASAGITNSRQAARNEPEGIQKDE